MDSNMLDAIYEFVKMNGRSNVSFTEAWEGSTIDGGSWTETDPATGTAWGPPSTLTTLNRGLDTAPNANETARLVSDFVYDVLPGVWGTNTIQQSLVLEFEAVFTTVANLDNTLCFFGLTSTVAADRTTNDIIGWSLTADALATLSDNGSTETTNTTLGETLTNLNLFTLEITTGVAIFKLNGAEVARHTTNLPDLPMYINFYLDTEGGGAATFELGKVRIYWKDNVFGPE